MIKNKVITTVKDRSIAYLVYLSKKFVNTIRSQLFKCRQFFSYRTFYSDFFYVITRYTYGGNGILFIYGKISHYTFAMCWTLRTVLIKQNDNLHKDSTG